MTARAVGIIGAGTMGAGIAQVAVSAGWRAVLVDVNDALVREAVAGIEKRLDRLVEKGRLTAAQRESAGAGLAAASSPADLAPCELVIEAVVENLDVKVAALRAVIPHLVPDAVIATNTSSLSVSRLGEAIGEAARTVGAHFFNPAPLLPLVEIVRGKRTDAEVVRRATEIVTGWGKTAVQARDTPGFIVNRVARPFYLEAWRLLAEGRAGVGRIDDAMRRLGGFRMGPFELTDLIGQDVNTATTRSVWEQLGRPARLAPSAIQEQLVADGRLGRKTGRGAYRHDTDPPEPAIGVQKRPAEVSRSLRDAADAFAAAATDAGGDDLDRLIFARVLAAIINEAAWAHHDGVANETDIDTAMTLGTNYPAGPFAWSKRLGQARCAALLEAMAATVDDDRYDAPTTTGSVARL